LTLFVITPPTRAGEESSGKSLKYFTSLFLDLFFLVEKKVL